MLEGRQNWFGRFEEGKNFLPLPGIEPPDHPALILVTIRLRCLSSSLISHVLITHLVMIFTAFMKSENPLPYLQEPAGHMPLM